MLWPMLWILCLQVGAQQFGPKAPQAVFDPEQKTVDFF
jgi:hypothetical protein